MTIVFWILVLYALFFISIAVDRNGGRRLDYSVDSDQPIALPMRIPAITDEGLESSVHTDLAV